jgi:hypothetical protein
MAIAIKSIPTLKSKEAKGFIADTELSLQKRGSVDFSMQVKSANSILNKAKLL